MLITTTPNVEGHRIVAYHGIVSGEAILGERVPGLLCVHPRLRRRTLRRL
jgi:uncharacterized protein YbjQ (UPF0145 family)